jgi:Erv1 / Alr family
MGKYLWGSHFWLTLHYACYYRTVTPTFVQSYADVIPCTECQLHFKELIALNPLPKNLDDSFEWSVYIHNEVNKRIGKPVYSLDQAYSLMKGERNNILVYVALVMVFLIILYFLRWKMNSFKSS